MLDVRLYGNRMAQVFLSYASDDRDAAKALVEIFRQHDWTVFWDRELRPGEQWLDVIGSELDKAQCVVLLWSKSAEESEWVQPEALRARNRGILVPVRIDDQPLPWWLETAQTADLRDWVARSEPRDLELSRVLASIDALVGSKKATDTQLTLDRRAELDRVLSLRTDDDDPRWHVDLALQWDGPNSRHCLQWSPESQRFSSMPASDTALQGYGCTETPDDLPVDAVVPVHHKGEHLQFIFVPPLRPVAAKIHYGRRVIDHDESEKPQPGMRGLLGFRLNRYPGIAFASDSASSTEEAAMTSRKPTWTVEALGGYAYETDQEWGLLLGVTNHYASKDFIAEVSDIRGISGSYPALPWGIRWKSHLDAVCPIDTDQQQVLELANVEKGTGALTFHRPAGADPNGGAVNPNRGGIYLCVNVSDVDRTATSANWFCISFAQEWKPYIEAVDGPPLGA